MDIKNFIEQEESKENNSTLKLIIDQKHKKFRSSLTKSKSSIISLNRESSTKLSRFKNKKRTTIKDKNKLIKKINSNDRTKIIKISREKTKSLSKSLKEERQSLSKLKHTSKTNKKLNKIQNQIHSIPEKNENSAMNTITTKNKKSIKVKQNTETIIENFISKRIKTRENVVLKGKIDDKIETEKFFENKTYSTQSLNRFYKETNEKDKYIVTNKKYDILKTDYDIINAYENTKHLREFLIIPKGNIINSSQCPLIYNNVTGVSFTKYYTKK